MCSGNPGAMVLQYGLKVPNTGTYVPFGGNVSQMALDLHRAQQLYDYGARLQYGLRGYPNSMGIGPYHPHSVDPYMQHYLYKDPRIRFIQEEPKPNHSYIGLIAMAILSSRDKKLVLSDIYQWILDNYPYFRTRGPGWRNSIRHNLSLNDCFIKSGRSANGKGHYWAIHPANIDDFQKGDFRRRRAQRRVRRHMGLSVPDDEDSPSPSPTSTSVTWTDCEDIEVDDKTETDSEKSNGSDGKNQVSSSDTCSDITLTVQSKTKKRLFDVESLLAPDDADRKNLMCSHFKEAVSSVSPKSIKTEFFSTEISKTEDMSSDIVSEKDNASNLSDNISRDHIEESKQDDNSHDSSDHAQEQTSLNDDIDNTWKHSLRNFAIDASHQSAFHNAARACSWSSISPYISPYPMLGIKANGKYPFILPRPAVTLDAAQKWTETMSQLVNKSVTEKMPKSSVVEN